MLLQRRNFTTLVRHLNSHTLIKVEKSVRSCEFYFSRNHFIPSEVTSMAPFFLDKGRDQRLWSWRDISECSRLFSVYGNLYHNGDYFILPIGTDLELKDFEPCEKEATRGRSDDTTLGPFPQVGGSDLERGREGFVDKDSSGQDISRKKVGLKRTWKMRVNVLRVHVQRNNGSRK